MRVKPDNIEKFEYNDLTSFLLTVVRRRPAMFLQEAKLSFLSVFILGYRMGSGVIEGPEDVYFGDDGFIEWYNKKYKAKISSYTLMPFLDKANGDEEKALTIYFKYLAKYQKRNNMLSSQ